TLGDDHPKQDRRVGSETGYICGVSGAGGSRDAAEGRAPAAIVGLPLIRKRQSSGGIFTENYCAGSRIHRIGWGRCRDKRRWRLRCRGRIKTNVIKDEFDATIALQNNCEMATDVLSRRENHIAIGK